MNTDIRNEILRTLKNLVEICKDGEHGFETAAKNIKEPEYQIIFNTYAQQRARFANELEAEIRRIGGDEDESTLQSIFNDAIGAVHRGWINLKSAVSNGDAEAILNECERGEDAAVEAYREALTKNLPFDVERLVRSQYMAVQEAHDRVRDLTRIEH